MPVRPITRRGTKVWVVDRIFQGPNGEERYRHDAQVQTRNGADAEERRLVAWWTEHGTIVGFRGESKATTVPSAPTTTWEDAVERYRKEILPTLKVSTRRGYEEILYRGFKEWAGIAVESIGLAAIQTWDRKICETGASESRRRNFHVVMRSVFHSAKDGKLLAREPEFPELPKVGRTVIQVPDPADVHTILDEPAPKNIRLRRAYAAMQFGLALSFYAGLRASEVRGLRACDIDMRTQTITVRTTRFGYGEDQSLDTPKSGHERPVPIAAPLLPLLEARLRGLKPDDFVAVNGYGQPWSESGLWQGLESACKRLGIPHARFHALRHAFVTGLFDAGVPAPVVQALAGHENLATTQRYAHYTREQARAAIAAYSRGNSVVTQSRDAQGSTAKDEQSSTHTKDEGRVS
jgi:integrase